MVHPSTLFIPQKLTRLVNLFLADNQLEAVPQIPESVRTLHLQVCLFSQYPDIYTYLYLVRTVTLTSLEQSAYLTSTSLEQ